jgi:hypothetical protein
MLAHHNTEDINIEAEIEEMNGGNEWLKHIQGGPKGKPYLAIEGRLKRKPKTLQVSAAQRRVMHG